MKQIFKKSIILVIALIFLIVSYLVSSNEPEALDIPEEQSNSQIKNLNISGSNIVSEAVLNHIFEGSINRRGEATGFHHKPSAPSQNTGIIKIIKQPNSCDVYVAQVKVNGKTKKSYSTMFPDKLNKSEITSIISTSYNTGKTANLNKSMFTVQTKYCFKLTMIENNGNLATAYPLY